MQSDKGARMNADAQLLLSLYRHAREAPPEAFQEAAMGLVRSVVRFESCIWGSGYFIASGDKRQLVPLSAYTSEIDPRGFEEWKAINRADKVIPIGCKVPRTTVQFHSPTLYASRDDAVMGDYARRFRRQSILATALEPGDALVFSWCSIYRPDPADVFREDERARCEVLVNHLNEASKVNRLVQTSAASSAAWAERDQGTGALATPDGRLLSAQPGFLQACARQWRAFDGANLPATVLAQLLASAEGIARLPRVVIRVRRLFGCLRLDAKPRTAADGPAPRRMDVAALHARGHSYKEIARMLGIAPATVRNHIAASYRSLGIASRAGLRAALAEGSDGPQ